MSEWFTLWPNPGMNGRRRFGPVQTRCRVRVGPGPEEFPADVKFWLSSAPRGVDAARGDLAAGRIFAVTSVEELKAGKPAPWGTTLASCTGFMFGREVPLWQGFGPNGEFVLALLRFIEALTADKARDLAAFYRGRPIVEWPKGLPSMDHPLYASTGGVIGRITLELLRLAPEDALDQYQLPRGKYRLAEPGWVALRSAGTAFARALMLPELIDKGTRDSFLDQWSLGLEEVGTSDAVRRFLRMPARG